MLQRLQHLEELTWKQVSVLSRGKGLTPEKPDSDSHKLILEEDPNGRLTGEKYYFHFRVDQSGQPFRVFGFQSENIFYITHFDPKGKIHSRAH